MQLVIDQGNTNVKAGVFTEEGVVVHTAVAAELTLPFLESLLKRFHPNAAILSSVKSPEATTLEYLKQYIPRFEEFNASTPLPIRNGYATPETLGLDRLAAAVGAWSLKPNVPLLVIDMGTAITYDFIAAGGVFMGGNIAPGLRTRLQSLHEHTHRLPLVEPEATFPFMGNTTEQAIRAGVMQGILFEINGYYKAMLESHPELFAFLTGGDLIFFADKLKNGIFVHENLVMTGLNRILSFHESI